MSDHPLLVLNSSKLLDAGTYVYAPLATDEARELAAAASAIISAIGHPATAAVLTRDLGTDIAHRRVRLTHQAIGQTAVVIDLHARVSFGQELSVADIDRIGYHLMTLTRTA